MRPAAVGRRLPAMASATSIDTRLVLRIYAWITIALFRLLRILPGVHLLYRLKDECRPFPRKVEDQLPLWREAKGRRVHRRRLAVNVFALLAATAGVVAYYSSDFWSASARQTPSSTGNAAVHAPAPATPASPSLSPGSSRRVDASDGRRAQAHRDVLGA